MHDHNRLRAASLGRFLHGLASHLKCWPHRSNWARLRLRGCSVSVAGNVAFSETTYRASSQSRRSDIIGVESVDDYLERAARAGAKILRDKQEIPTVWFAGYIQDPEGNTVGLFESSDGGSS